MWSPVVDRYLNVTRTPLEKAESCGTTCVGRVPFGTSNAIDAVTLLPGLMLFGKAFESAKTSPSAS